MSQLEGAFPIAGSWARVLVEQPHIDQTHDSARHRWRPVASFLLLQSCSVHGDLSFLAHAIK